LKNIVQLGRRSACWAPKAKSTHLAYVMLIAFLLQQWLHELASMLRYTYIAFLGKAVPLEAWSGPEGSSKLRFPDFMTTAQDGGKVVSLTHRPPLPPENTPGTHFC